MKKKGSDNRYYCIPVLRGWIFLCTPWQPSRCSSLYCIERQGLINRYHHPSKEVVSRLDELGIPHMCTQDYGRLHVCLDKSDVSVAGFLR